MEGGGVRVDVGGDKLVAEVMQSWAEEVLKVRICCVGSSWTYLGALAASTFIGRG